MGKVLLLKTMLVLLGFNLSNGEQDLALLICLASLCSWQHIQLRGHPDLFLHTAK